MENFTIGDVEKRHLSRAAKWAGFIAVVHFIFMPIMVLVSLVSIVSGQAMTSAMEAQGMTAGMVRAQGIWLLLLCLFMFYFVLQLLRFAKRTQRAIVEGDQEQMALAFKSLSNFFWIGGLMIIVSFVVVIVALVVLISAGLVGALS